MNTDWMFIVTFISTIVCFLVINSSNCNIIVWLLGVFGLIVSVPLLLYSALKDYRKT